MDEDREGEIPGGLFCEALKFRAPSASPSSHTAVSRVGDESHDATPGRELEADLVSRQTEYGVMTGQASCALILSSVMARGPRAEVRQLA